MDVLSHPDFPATLPNYSPDSIVDGRIKGTRITVYMIYYYLVNKASIQNMVEWLQLSVDQVLNAIAYIRLNEESVRKVHEQIEERIARGNPEWVEKLGEQTRAKMKAMLESRGIDSEGYFGGS